MNELSRAFVPEDSLDAIGERVNRVIKRASKKGFPAPRLRIVGTEDRPVRDEQGEVVEGQFMKWVEVVIEGEPIKFSDWELVGVVSYIETEDGTKPVVDKVPGVEASDLAVVQYDYCDYCKASRVRNETFIVCNGATTRQVGRNCLRDFLGHSPDALISMYEAYGSLELDESEIRGWERNAVVFYPPEHIVTIAARVVAREGYYVSRVRAEEDDRTSTAEIVRNFLSAKGKELAEYTGRYPLNDEAEMIRDLTLAAIPTLDPHNEYEDKLITLLTSKGVQWRHIGTLASSVILGLRARERKANSNAKGESHFIGQIGERITLPVKVTMKRTLESAYGPGIQYLIRMIANDSDDILWWASYSDATKEIEEGEEFAVTGTVKDHEYDKRTERPTTVLTRCKVARGTI